MVGALFPVSIWLSIARLTPDSLASRSSEWPCRVLSRLRLRPRMMGSSLRVSGVSGKGTSSAFSPVTAGSPCRLARSNEIDGHKPDRQPGDGGKGRHHRHCHAARGRRLLSEPRVSISLEIDHLCG